MSRDVTLLLRQLEDAYGRLCERLGPWEADRERLVTVAADLRWYAGRLGAERWTETCGDRWSFADNIAHITEQAREHAVGSEAPRPITYYIDHGKEHVGQVAELYALFEYTDY